MSHCLTRRDSRIFPDTGVIRAWSARQPSGGGSCRLEEIVHGGARMALHERGSGDDRPERVTDSGAVLEPNLVSGLTLDGDRLRLPTGAGLPAVGAAGDGSGHQLATATGVVSGTMNTLSPAPC